MRTEWMGIFVLLQNILQFGSGREPHTFHHARNSLPQPLFGSDVNVTCEAQEMSITIAEDFLRRHSDMITSVNRLCLGDRKCCASYVNGEVLIRLAGDFSLCGNKISVMETFNETGKASVTHYKFTNKLIYDGGSGPINRDILLVNFHCLYAADMLITAKPSDSAISSRVIRIKKVSGEMRVFKSNAFDEKYDQVPAGPERQPVFIKIKIKDPGFLKTNKDELKVVSVIKQCTANDATVQHQIVKDGCSTNEKTEVISSGKSLESSIRVEIDKIATSESMNVTIRCLMDLCIRGTGGTCEPDCISRRKRSMNQIHKNHQFGDHEQTYLLNFNGEEFSATIFLSTTTQINSTKLPENPLSITSFKSEDFPIKTSSNKMGRIYPKLLLPCILGGSAVILLLVLTSFAMLFYRLAWRKRTDF